ncbi:MAG: hypothetical protein AAB911_00585 [Patescibacteria group bacterium]
MLSDRQKLILKAIIEEYIREAEPVSSKVLATKRGVALGAPMLRKEMNSLEEGGYLLKPHTSSGRVPTDKAYRMYIQEELAEKNKKPVVVGLTAKESERVAATLNKKWPDDQTLLKEISRLVSEISKDLSVAGTVGGENSYTFGFSNLSREPEFQTLDSINQLMHFMDNVDSHFEELWRRVLNDGLSVFIGAENPIKEINEFTLITGKYQLPEGEQGFVSIIGPRRMNYKRNMSLVKYISEHINNINA